MRVDVIYSEPLPPPVSKVVITLTPGEADLLAKFLGRISFNVVKDLMLVKYDHDTALNADSLLANIYDEIYTLREDG